MPLMITVEDAQVRLKEIIHQLAPGDEIILTENQQPIAKLTSQPAASRRREPGRCKGMMTIIVEDDEHLDIFKDYMP